MPDASFDHPYIPPLEEREYVKADEKILDALLHFEDAGRTIAKSWRWMPGGRAIWASF